MRCVGRSAGLPALQGCLPNLGLTQQLATSRRAALPTLPREQRAPTMQQLAAECLPASMSISHLWRLYSSLHEQLRLSELCASVMCLLRSPPPKFLIPHRSGTLFHFFSHGAISPLAVRLVSRLCSVFIYHNIKRIQITVTALKYVNY